MKKYIIMVCAGLLSLTSCMNDFEEINVPNQDLLTATDIAAPTTTIAQVRKDYSSEISNSNYRQVTKDEIFEGVVVGNDITGNIYQCLYLHGLNADGTPNTDEGGISIGIKGIGCLYTFFPVGQVIRVNLKGLYVGGYGACPRVGMPYVNTNGALKLGQMDKSMVKTNIQKVGKPRPELVSAKEVTAADLTAANITKLTPMLVVIRNAEIKGVGDKYAAWEPEVYSINHDISIGGTNVKELLYTSTSAEFAADTIQSGKKTLYGILSRYSSSYQLSLRSLDDIVDVK